MSMSPVERQNVRDEAFVEAAELLERLNYPAQALAVVLYMQKTRGQDKSAEAREAGLRG